MLAGLLASQTPGRRRLVALVCAGPALAWLALAQPVGDWPSSPSPAEPAVPLVCVWFPLVAAPLIWSHTLRR